MKTKLQALMIMLLGYAGSAFAAGAEPEGLSLATKLFLAFLGLIVAFQFVPAVTLLCSMLKGLFSRTPQADRLDRSKGHGKSA